MFYWFTYDTTNGQIKSSHSLSIQPDLSDIVAPLAYLGLFDDSNVNMDAVNHPGWYVVQNGQLAQATSYNQLQLQDAQARKIAQLQDGQNQTLNGGFTSKSTSHTYVTTTNGQSNMEGDIKRFELDNTLTSVQFFTLDAGWIAHSHADLQNAFLDGGKWKDAQFAQYNNLKNQVNAATTVSAVEAITWTPGTY